MRPVQGYLAGSWPRRVTGHLSDVAASSGPGGPVGPSPSSSGSYNNSMDGNLCVSCPVRPSQREGLRPPSLVELPGSSQSCCEKLLTAQDSQMASIVFSHTYRSVINKAKI